MSLLEPGSRDKRKEKAIEIEIEGELGKDILYIESWVSVSRQYVLFHTTSYCPPPIVFDR